MTLIRYRYCFDMELPTQIWQSADMRRLWDETNVNIST